MKVLLYLEGKSVLEKSGIGRALHHQMHALDLAGIPYTTDILGGASPWRDAVSQL